MIGSQGCLGFGICGLTQKPAVIPTLGVVENRHLTTIVQYRIFFYVCLVIPMFFRQRLNQGNVVFLYNKWLMLIHKT
jgi:hypothetical protein